MPTNTPTSDPISDDLTDGVIYGDRYHTISTVAESPVQAGVLYAGTTDANVWRSLDEGDDAGHIVVSELILSAGGTLTTATMTDKSWIPCH